MDMRKIIKHTVKIIIIMLLFIYNYSIYAAEECYNSNNVYSVSNKIIDMQAKQKILIFSKILNELGIQHNPNDINSINECFQKFRRTSNQERWQIADLHLSKQQQETILSCISELNIITDIHAPANFYQYALIFGATAPVIKARIEYLGKEWNNGIRCSEIVLLGANRKLNKDRDYNVNILQRIFAYIINNKLITSANSTKIMGALANKNTDFSKQFTLAKEIVTDNPKLRIFSDYLSATATEADAALAMLTIASIPKAMQNLPVSLITTPDVKRADNIVFRANTAETIEYWLNNYDLQKTSVIAVSNQPYIVYQQQVLNNTLNNQFRRVDIIGEKDNSINKSAKIELYLDTLALFLHNHMQAQQR